jgi:hypothetical protein
MRPNKTGAIPIMIDARCGMIGVNCVKIAGKSAQTSIIVIGTNSDEIGGSCVTIGLISYETGRTCAGTAGTTGLIASGELSDRGEML